MEQDIRFCELGGQRIAYATVGEGPLLLFGGRWVTHLEEEWATRGSARFFEELALRHRVVRYDRIGAGLSDRTSPARRRRVELETLAAVHAACGSEPATIFACSCAGLATTAYASAFPERVRKIVFFGGYVSRADIPEATRRSLVDFVRTNWPLAAQMLAGLFLPHGSGDEIEASQPLSAPLGRRGGRRRVSRSRSDSDAARSCQVTMPALVLHRRGDRTVPISRGRELAALLPNARFVTLSGDSHLPWADDQRELQRALAGFLDDVVRAERTATRH